MKTNTIARIVKVTITNRELLVLFVQAVGGDAVDSTGKQRTSYKALGHLVDISDTDAVVAANRDATKEDRITVIEFRQWLPTIFAEFARAMLEMDDDRSKLAQHD